MTAVVITRDYRTADLHPLRLTDITTAARALLRPRRERPHSRAAEQRDEGASLQLTKLHPLPPSVERQDSGLASIKSGLPRCGILTRLLTG